MSQIDDLVNDAEEAYNLGDKGLSLKIYEKVDKLKGEMEKDQNRKWSDVPREALGNLPMDVVDVAKSSIEPLLHPIESAQAALDLGNAAVQKVLPQPVIDVMHKLNPETAKNPEKLQAVFQAITDEYGSMDNFKKTLATHPARVAADLATFIQPARLLTKNKALSALSNLDPSVAPFAAVGKLKEPISNLTASALGTHTGVGDVPIREAYQAGYSGGDPLDALMRHMRKEEGTSLTEPVDILEQSLKNMRGKTSKDYQAGMQDIRQNESLQRLFNRYNPLDFVPVEQAARGALNMKKYDGFDKNPNLQTQRNAIMDAMQRWKDEQQPTSMQRLQGVPRGKDFRNVAGFDALKQGIHELGDWNNPRDPSTMMASNVSNAIKDEISKQSNSYAGLMRDQARRIREADDIEKTFNLKPNTKDETQLTKAQGLTRNNVNTSYGLRMDKLRELEPYGAENVLPMLSGQALSPYAPRGLARAGATSVGAYLAGGVPLTIADLMLSSPRLVGEAAVATGKAARYGEKGLNAYKNALDAAGIDQKYLNNMMYQLQSAQDAYEEEE